MEKDRRLYSYKEQNDFINIFTGKVIISSQLYRNGDILTSSFPMKLFTNSDSVFSIEKEDNFLLSKIECHKNRYLPIGLVPKKFDLSKMNFV